MKTIQEFLQKDILIIDGAMGTYYAQLTGDYGSLPELVNLTRPEVIAGIHREYIEAGARLIKTNTFSANRLSLGAAADQLEEIIAAAVRIAREAAGDSVFVAASIGPVSERTEAGLEEEELQAEYRRIADEFLQQGIRIFMFETFSDAKVPVEMSRYIKAKAPEAFISAQFATTPEGFTRQGISSGQIISEVKGGLIDAYGFNCGIGPTHLYNALKKLDFGNDIIAAAPNAGYPEIINERTVYIQNPAYFADKMQEISELGVKILGGCCGTTPQHIAQLTKRLQSRQSAGAGRGKPVSAAPAAVASSVRSEFAAKLAAGKFVVAVEVDPPFNADASTIVENAKICRKHGVDLITIADSPMGRARMDSIMAAAKIHREADIEVMPHVCCRDRNVNALKSALLAGHAENIRNILAVTGDPIAPADKNNIKSVFDVNSFKLMELIRTMNEEVFSGSPMHIAGALNLNGNQPELEIGRMVKKVQNGAGVFLTQPIYDDAVIKLLPELKARNQAKILAGIMPLVSYRNACFLNNEVAGIRIPEEIIARFDRDMDKEAAETVGIEIAVALAEKIRPHVDGFYFITPFNRVGMIMKIMAKLQLATE